MGLHLREVPIYVKSFIIVYCDIIKHEMTSLLTLSGNIQQNETKKKAVFLLAFSLNSGSKYIFS